jgi:uncharacterized protein
MPRSAPQGSLSAEQALLLLRHLPADVSFADERDVLLYWCGATYDTCDPAFIGRDVRDCHPEASMAVLEEILRAFKNGERDLAEGWSRDGNGGVALTQYFAVRDDAGAYRGILELNRDVSTTGALQGDQALPGWEF